MTKKIPRLMRPSRSSVSFSKPSKTVRSQAYDADINNMVKGIVPFSQNRSQPYYIDETIFPQNYEAQFNAVLEAQDAFMQLPPDVREYFGNDPAQLVAALGDPSRSTELVDLGLLESQQASPTKTPEPSPAPQGAQGSSKEASD